MANSLWYEVGRTLRQLLLGRTDGKTEVASHTSPKSSATGTKASPGQHGIEATRDVMDAEARQLRIEYSPNPDGDPDPGEVVWTWVPFQEDDGRGKDRPVLIVGRLPDGAVAGCYLSTKQHPGFIPVGTGGWDSQGRPSYLSPERLLRITDKGMRREGHVLAKDRFLQVAMVVARQFGVNSAASDTGKPLRQAQ